MHLLSFMCLLWPVLTILARQCGFPRTLGKGTVRPNKTVYNEEEHVTYTCDRGYYFKYDSHFFKWTQRTCQNNGLWNGTIPACDYYDLIYDTSITLGLNNIMDERDDTCEQAKFATTKNGSPKQWEITVRFDWFHAGPLLILVRLGEGGLPGHTTMSVQVDRRGTNQCSPASISEPGISEFSSICKITSKEDDHKVSLAFWTWGYESYVSICSFKGLVLVSPKANEEISTSPLFKTTSTIVLVLLIADLVALIIIYCLVRYCCRKPKPTRARPQLEANDQQNQNQKVRVEPEVLPLHSISRDGRNLPANNGRCLTSVLNTYSVNYEEHIYAEIDELAVFSTAQSTTEEPEVMPNNGWSPTNDDEENSYVERGLLPVFPIVQTTTAQIHYENIESCSGANEREKANFNDAKIPIQQDSSFTDTYGFFSSNTTTTAQHLYKNKEPYVGANEGGNANVTNAQVPIQQDSIDTYGTFSSSTKSSPTNTTPLSSIPLKTSKPTTKSESGKLQSLKSEPSPRKVNKEIDCSEPSYVNVPKKT